MRWFTAISCITLIVTSYGVYQMARFNEAAQALIYNKDMKMQTARTSWTSSGKTVSVETTRKEGESATAFAERHKEAVDAMLIAFPKDT